MPETSITLPAFAKINWNLRVIGKRADGYHELETILQTITLHDTIHLTATDGPEINLSCDDRSLPTGTRNLVYRAAQALQARFGQDRGARIRLEKRIPLQAGLGGGSSDAAIALIGLAYLWNLKGSFTELTEIAATLGADVPFFLNGGTARGTGIGTQLTRLPDVLEKFLLILKPNANVSTAQAYQALNAPSLTTLSGNTILSGSLAQQNLDHAQANDFESVVFRLGAEIERAKTALTRAGAGQATLAGSGSAVFGIFDNREAQERAIQAIELEPGWRVFPCTTVGRDQYQRAMGACGDMLARLSEGMNAGA